MFFPPGQLHAPPAKCAFRAEKKEKKKKENPTTLLCSPQATRKALNSTLQLRSQRGTYFLLSFRSGHSISRDIISPSESGARLQQDGATKKEREGEKKDATSQVTLVIYDRSSAPAATSLGVTPTRDETLGPR